MSRSTRVQKAWNKDESHRQINALVDRWKAIESLKELPEEYSPQLLAERYNSLIRALRGVTRGPASQSTLRPGICGWDDAIALGTTLKTTGSGVPTFTQVGSSEKWGHEFTDESVSGNEKRGYVETQLPHRYKAGAEVRFHLHLHIGAAPATDETIEFSLAYSWDNAEGSVPGSTTITKTLVIPSTAADYQTIVLGFPAVTGTGMKESSLFGGTIRRLSAGANDDYGASVWLSSSDAHVRIEKMGTVPEFPN